MIQYRVKRNAIVVFIIASSLLIFVNEFFIYLLHRWGWSSLTCRSDKCLRILLVADPQILGETLDTNLYNGIAIHDSDKYLKKTFIHALNYVEPDVICFMGDLMDEGSIADDDQFKRYLNRFGHVYETYNTVQKIYIPGDNDIGGEGNDHVSAFKVNRFRATYNETDLITIQNYFRFINLNLLTHKYPESIKENSSTSDMLNIALSHISILTYPGLTMKEILDNFQPDVIFSAHSHISRIITYPDQTADIFTDNRIISIDLKRNRSGNKRNFFEIMVPTSSYRMGVKNIGHGFAIIDEDQLRYTVLWSPDRFLYLWVYIYWLCVIAAIGLAWFCRSLPLCKRRVSYRFRLMIDTDKF